MSQTHIAIYGRAFNASVNPYVEQLFTYLAQKNVRISIHQEFYEFLQTTCLCPDNLPVFHSHNDFPKDVDFMLSLGGDGTMLAAVSIVRDTHIPIAGINFGRLGFLANIPKTEIDQALDQILAGKYSTQERALLSVSAKDIDLFEGENFALNDITVFRFDTSSMITIDAQLDGELLNSYWSDGLIIATPTGSTAYSLSCGGPIMMPGSGNFVITPISPHNLDIDLFEGENFALNDITVFRFDTSSMITIDAQLDGELLNSYWSDGLIIATPTGSTAYSLSCGGPIMMPGSGNFVITPISPHN